MRCASSGRQPCRRARKLRQDSSAGVFEQLLCSEPISSTQIFIVLDLRLCFYDSKLIMKAGGDQTILRSVESGRDLRLARDGQGA